jgi:hypothetical protein
VHLTFGGAGTAEDAARRDLPQIAGEYFMMGPMPAYGLYARNVHGITMQNEAITIDGGDRSKAASAIALRAWRHGKLRENTRVNKGEEWIRTSLVESC